MSAVADARRLEARVRRALGLGRAEALTWTPLAGAHASARVFRVRSGAGSWIVKRSTGARAFTQERAAYRRWCPALRARLAGSGVTTPRLLAALDDDRVLLLSDEPGARPQRAREPDALAWDHMAGAFLRALHGLPADDDDPLPLVSAAAQRLEAALRRAEPALDRGSRAALRRRYGQPDALAGTPRTPCHRDFGPHNWLVSEGPGDPARRLVVLDFEHARPDAWASDLVKLACGRWRRRPAGAEAFGRGYGRAVYRQRGQLDPALAWFVALHGVATVAWAHAHRDREYLERGLDAVELALA